MLQFIIVVVAYLIALHMTHIHLKMITSVQTVFYGDHNFYYLTSYAHVVIDDQPMQHMNPIVYPTYDNTHVYVTPRVNRTNSLQLFGQMM
jgi:hypothetical protein